MAQTNYQQMASVMQQYGKFSEAVKAINKTFPEIQFTQTDYEKAWLLANHVCPECRRPFNEPEDYEGLCSLCVYCGKWLTIAK